MLRKPHVNSIAGCVNFGRIAHFLQKFPVFPCFLFHAVCVLADFVCATGRGI